MCSQHEEKTNNNEDLRTHLHLRLAINSKHLIIYAQVFSCVLQFQENAHDSGKLSCPTFGSHLYYFRACVRRVRLHLCCVAASLRVRARRALFRHANTTKVMLAFIFLLSFTKVVHLHNSISFFFFSLRHLLAYTHSIQK